MRPGESPLGEEFRSRWRAAFQRYALLNEDDAGIAGWTPSGLEARIRLFRRQWSAQPPGAFWIDIGCGAGTYTRFLHEQRLVAIGIDYSLPTLVKARARSSGEIRWFAADVSRLPLPDESCDGALCFGVLQALPSSDSALRSIARVLRPGGTLWIDALNGHCVPNRLAAYRRRRAGRPAHLRYETAETMIRSLEACGFESVTLHWTPILPLRLRRLQGAVEGRLFRALLRQSSTMAAWCSHSMLIEARRRAA